LLYQQAYAFQLDGERRERVGQDVVDLAGEAGALVEGGRAHSRVAPGRHFSQQRLGRPLLLLQAAIARRGQVGEGEAHGRRDQAAEVERPRRGESGCLVAKAGGERQDRPQRRSESAGLDDGDDGHQGRRRALDEGL